MNVVSEIERLRGRIEQHTKQIAWLEANRAKLEALPDGRMCDDKLDFDNLQHADVVKVVRAIGGKV